VNTFSVNVTSRHSVIPKLVTAVIAIAEKHGLGYSAKEIGRSWLWGTTTTRIVFEAGDDKSIGPAVVEFQSMLSVVGK